VLRRIFGTQAVEVKEKWPKIDNEDLNKLYFSPNIVRVIKSRSMRWADHVASTGRVEVHRGILVENRRERDYLEDPAVDVNVILSRMIRRWNGEHGLD
jgi:hypothetical protein